MLRSKLPWTLTDKVLLLLTSYRIFTNHISCSIDLCERREGCVHTDEWTQQDLPILMGVWSF